MPAKVVETIFKGQDRVSKVLNQMTKNSKKFGDTTKRSMDKASKSALGLGKIVGGIFTAGVISRGLNRLQMGVRAVTDEFLDFDDAITAASAKFGVFDRESEAFKQMKTVAREVGATTEFTSAQAAEGLRFLAKAGWEANHAMKALPSFVNLATASEMEFSRAADIATDVMGAFRMRTGDLNKDLLELTRVNDVLSKAVNMSNIDMENLFESIKFAGPIAKTAGIDLEKFAAMAAFVGGAGIKGSLGGTALKNMFLNLAAPTKKQTQLLRKFGIQVQTTKGDLRDPIEVLKELSDRMKKMGTAQRAAALDVIFGRRAVSGASVSMDGATKALGDFEKALDKSSGNSKKLAEFMRTSMKKRLAELKSSAIEVGFKFIDSFEKKMPGAVDKLVKALRGINVKVIIEDIKNLAKVASDVVSVLREYAPILKAIAISWAALKIGTMIQAVGILATKFVALVSVAGGLLPALAALLGPIGAVAAAIFGVGAATFTVIDRWDELKAATSWFVDDMLGLFNKLLDNKFFMAIGTLLAPWLVWPAKIIKEWRPIKEFFKEIVIDFKTLTNKAFGVFGAKGPFDTKVEKTKLPGSDKIVTPKPLIEPPNKAAEEARQSFFLEGNITLANAPKGSTFEVNKKKAPRVQTEVLGYY